MHSNEKRNLLAKNDIAAAGVGMYDVAVIGGGINGCGVARDLAGRGLRVFLAEKDDLASGTSSASTKLIHGGLRYLEHYEFGLVREALREREVLLRMAPHIIWPMRFVLPHHRGLRPAWLIRLGLFLYDHLGGRKLLPGSRSLDLRRDEAGGPLKDAFVRGFEYSDCWVDDARLVVLNAADAVARGATVRVRTEVTQVVRGTDHWDVSVTDRHSGQSETVSARAVVNAAGPWVAEVLARRIGSNEGGRVRLVKGSHIVVPRLFDHERAYIFQNNDDRIIFAIPYQTDFTLIGTTDVDYRGDLGAIEITPEETEYLCESASNYFEAPIAATDVVWTYSGVRPLYGDGDGDAQKVTRDDVLEPSGKPGEPVLLNIYGGKITTYRRLAEAAAVKLGPWLPNMGPAWTRGATLPGGDFAVDGVGELRGKVKARCAGLAEGVAARLCRSYGTNVWQIIGEATDVAGLGADFGGGLYEAEVSYLINAEWARTAEDILWRRSKLGLRLADDEVQRLNDFVGQQAVCG